MVLRCKELSPGLLDSALNRVAQELEDSFSNSVNNNDPVPKATSNKKANQMVTFILIIHGCSFVNGVEGLVKQIDGVKRVKSDHNSIKLEVIGKVDPFKVRELVERETEKKVELIFPLPQMERNRVGNQVSQEKLKTGKKKIFGNDVAKKKIHLPPMPHVSECVSVLKIKLCCDSCNQKLRKELEIRGLETVTMDIEKDLVTVKGAVDMTEVRSYIKDKLKKDVEILLPSEFVIPTKKEYSVAYKKDKDDGATNKNDKGSTGISDKKKRGTVAVDEKDKGTAAFPKQKGIATVDEKDKGKAATFYKKYRGTIAFDEKFEGAALIFEKNKGMGAVTAKNKGIATLDEKDTGSAVIDEKGKASTTTVGKYRDKDEKKDKDKDNGGRGTKYKAFDDGGGDERGGDEGGSGKKDEGAGTRLTANTKIQCGYDDYKRDYLPEWTAKYSNGLDLMFSDENPHSCCIM